MGKYIDKDALVAEIERRIKRFREEKDSVSIVKTNTYKGLLSFIDTLEVKEVDFEKYYHDFLQKEWYNSHVRTVSEMMAFTAKHFFELGLSVSNESQKKK